MINNNIPVSNKCVSFRGTFTLKNYNSEGVKEILSKKPPEYKTRLDRGLEILHEDTENLLPNDDEITVSLYPEKNENIGNLYGSMLGERIGLFMEYRPGVRSKKAGMVESRDIAITCQRDHQLCAKSTNKFKFAFDKSLELKKLEALKAIEEQQELLKRGKVESIRKKVTA